MMNNIIQEDVRRLAELPLWHRFKKKSILITGATGLLGAYITLAAVEANRVGAYGMKLYALGRDEQKWEALYQYGECTFLQQDIRAPLTVDGDLHFIVHTAGPVGPRLFAETPLEIISTNAEGILALIHAARQRNCESFVFASTHEVYGAAEGEKRETDMPVGVDLSNSRSCYILGKQACENALVCASTEYGLHATSMRLARLYGPLMNLDSGLFVCDFIKDICGKRPVRIHGGLNLIRPLCYVADAAEAALRILADGVSGEAYNVQGDETPTIGEIAALLSGTVIADKPETNDLPHSGHWLNTDKLKALGWRQTMPLADGLRRTVSYNTV